MTRSRWRSRWAPHLLLGTGLIAAGAATACTPAAPPDYARTPILFVHGHGDNGQHTWAPMIRHLTTFGYPVDYLMAPDLLPPDGANIPAAEGAIAAGVDTLLARARRAAEDAQYEGNVPAKVDIVTHSMGALSGRWYAAKLRPELVRRWVSLAGANHGTDALCGWGDPGSEDLCPAFAASSEDSPIQVALNGTQEQPCDETPHGLGLDRTPGVRVDPSEARRIAYFTISTNNDRWIVPERSAWLDGAGGVGIDIPADLALSEPVPGNFVYEGSDHDRLPKERNMFRFLRLLLSTP